MEKVKLLIADDEKLIREGLLSLPWETVGVNEVLSAENGMDARKILLEQSVDVILSDIKMPGLSGLELAQCVQEYSLDTVIILLTGFSDFQYVQDAIRKQVFDYILKPLHPQDILQAVKRALLEKKKRSYQAEAVLAYETKSGSYDIKDQLERCFPTANDQVMEILLYMAEAYDEEITLSTLSEKYHFSSTYLSRLFRKETNCSFSDILTGIRLIQSLRLLSDEKCRVMDACAKAGFRDPRYFGQVFKKTIGCTPGEYRKNPEKIKLRQVLDYLNRK